MDVKILACNWNLLSYKLNSSVAVYSAVWKKDLKQKKSVQFVELASHHHLDNNNIKKKQKKTVNVPVSFLFVYSSLHTAKLKSTKNKTR